MPQPVNVDKTRTCRYWALGPACPNIDAFGTITCSYAHWDTGRLASHHQQRGTCIPWKYYGYCGRGVGCWYEHRDTGVDGLFQGTIDLNGIELEIADAASKAGFDTFNHEALFDLIWAVKRVALKTSAAQLAPPFLPRTSIYPDRYRPRRFGKKSRKKSKTKAFRQPPNLNVELKFHPVKPLMRKRPHTDVKEEDLIDFTAASDTVRRPLQPTSHRVSVKRQKILKHESMPKGGLQPTSTMKPPSSAYSISTGASREPQATLASSQTAIPNPGFEVAPPLAPETEITNQLNQVKAKLDDARMNMNHCQSAMKELFDVHCHRFDNNQIMASLQKLSDCMNKIYDGSKAGAGEIEAVVDLVNGRELI
ncbi:hypothetical protein PV08_11416 [Exophiala spinifera]|uniref:C3H1-type domain-containing protein n=1 Tax=Exophiala spinifera TaxID=91928 RepID=A0A0D1ZBT7_9EURO|nr:uncharacterized protein PV08_11416 [Exophiala spinifera]KIW10452.1 hypothetical protein PV08_11416 [Exophiala spinifera]